MFWNIICVINWFFYRNITCGNCHGDFSTVSKSWDISCLIFRNKWSENKPPWLNIIAKCLLFTSTLISFYWQQLNIGCNRLDILNIFNSVGYNWFYRGQPSQEMAELASPDVCIQIRSCDKISWKENVIFGGWWIVFWCIIRREVSRTTFSCMIWSLLPVIWFL